MESRVNHLLVGTFVLLVLAATFGFVIWLARVDLQEDVREYQIFFHGSVQGLGVGGPVRYRGIKVGTISHIAIDPEDPSRVNVVVRVNSETPIRNGDIASLQIQSLTGIAAINIEGAVAGAGLLIAEDDRGLPVIPSRQSQLEKLFENAPQLLDRGITLAERASQLLREENQQLITATLKDINALTSVFAERRGEIATLLETLGEAGTEITASARRFRHFSGRLDGLAEQAGTTLEMLQATLTNFDQTLDEDTATMTRDVREAANSVERVADETHRLLRKNRESLDQFIGDGLVEFSRLVTEARLLIASFARVTERLETDGARFLLGVPESEYEAK